MKRSPKKETSTLPATQLANSPNKLAGDDFSTSDEVGSKLTVEEVSFVRTLSARWGGIEPQLEAVNNWDADLQDKLGKYVQDLRAEVESLKKHRNWAVIVASAIIIILLGTLLCFLYRVPEFFLHTNSYAGTALIVAVISSVVLITRAMLLGVFKSLKERNDGDMSPKAILEAAVQAKSMTE